MAFEGKREQKWVQQRKREKDRKRKREIRPSCTSPLAR
jgi:hypothetical protein